MNNKIYTFEEAFKSSLQYFDGDELAAKVWVTKYALKDSQGNIYEENPQDMHYRLAREISRIEQKYKNPLSEKELFELFDHFKYIIPQGSPMTGIGNNYQIASLSNCFVIGSGKHSDSYGGILNIDQEQVQLMKRRGGVGHDLSHIRPKGSPVKNSALTSTGIVPFMERYSNTTREVAQDGRRGALMLSLSINHPDAEDFINSKTNLEKITGANISVKIDDDFMNSVINDKTYTQKFPIYSDNSTTKKDIKAKLLWDTIINNAWSSAEPGVLFWDTIIRESIPDCYSDLGFKTVSTNPCGEIPLCSYDSCRLLAINLYSYVVNPFKIDSFFDFELFKNHVKIAQRIMDDIIDLETEKINQILNKISEDPEDDETKRIEINLWTKILNKTLKGRRTGLGITAEADMLAALGLYYGTETATNFSEKVHKALAISAYSSSINMAQERGSFEIYDPEREKNNPFILRLKESDPDLYKKMTKYGRRNIACLTIAPTGSTSILSQTTSGVEPLFLPVYKRRRKINPNDADSRIDFVDDIGDSFEEYTLFHPKFITWMNINGYEIKENYSNEEIEKLVSKSPYYKATSNDVDWLEKVRMQGKIQKWVDHSISVTINLPNDVSPELVSQLYMEAWKNGCKGCTVYRDGSRAGVLISNNDNKTKKEKSCNHHYERPSIVSSRPIELDADVIKFQNNKEKWIAFIGLLDGRPYEIFTGINDEDDGILLPKSTSTGKIIKAYDNDGNKHYNFQFKNRKGYKITIEGLDQKFDPEYWNYAKLISGVLRYGMPIDQVVKLVSGLELDSETINTWKNGVERALKKYLPNNSEVKNQKCPVCSQETLMYQEGCMKCRNCGASKCG